MTIDRNTLQESRTAGFPPIGGIDSHAHVFVPGLPVAAQRRYTPDYAAPLEQYLEQLDEQGLAYGVLVQPSFLGTDNAYMLDALRQARGRCRGVAVVDPDADLGSLRAMDACGVTGARLNLFGRPLPDFTQPAWREFFKNLNVLGWHVEVHCPYQQLPQVMPGLLQGADRIVVDHLGRPDFKHGVQPDQLAYLCGLAASGRVWVKLSAAYRIWPRDSIEGAAPVLRHLIECFGTGRLMWGSDWPHTEHESFNSMRKSLHWLIDAVASQEDLAEILLHTPKSFFGFWK
ncbi:MAG: amidohydrolase family protein [Burkholderiaceae bacterium]